MTALSSVNTSECFAFGTERQGTSSQRVPMYVPHTFNIRALCSETNTSSLYQIMSYTEQHDVNYSLSKYKEGLSNDTETLSRRRVGNSLELILHSETFSRRVRHLENILSPAKEYNYLDYLLKQWALYKTDNLGISHLMSVHPTWDLSARDKLLVYSLRFPSPNCVSRHEGNLSALAFFPRNKTVHV